MSTVYLTIDKQDIDKINQVVEYAHLNRLSVSTLIQMMDGSLPPIGDNPKHCVILGNTLVCVFSVDSTSDGENFVKHLSASMLENKAYPPPLVLNVLLPYFGFEHDLYSDQVMLYPEKEKFAVNVIEYLHSKPVADAAGT